MPRVSSLANGTFDELWSNSTTLRRSRVHRDSYNHKPEWPKQRVQNPLLLYYVKPSKLDRPWPLNSLGNNRNPDMPNCSTLYAIQTAPWDARLYAQAYDKFFNAAREGTAEIGMNAIQYRQTLSMLVKYVNLSANTVLSINRGLKRGVEWLNANPSSTKSQIQSRIMRRREAIARATGSKRAARLKREVSILEEASAALLAYRYGVVPLMSDIATVCDILSKDHNGDVVYRKSARTPWNHEHRSSERREDFLGTESCVLTGRCLVSNPNLLLANRLGIINPQMWIWDAIPWSFVVDWWFPVGKFLNNFTASVGLTVVDSSITRMIAGDGTMSVLYDAVPGMPIEWRSLGYTVKYKRRTIGPFPMPFSVPYGTGLGLQRAQNALALLMQFFSKKAKGIK